MSTSISLSTTIASNSELGEVLNAYGPVLAAMADAGRDVAINIVQLDPEPDPATPPAT